MISNKNVNSLNVIIQICAHKIGLLLHLCQFSTVDILINSTKASSSCDSEVSAFSPVRPPEVLDNLVVKASASGSIAYKNDSIIRGIGALEVRDIVNSALVN